MMLVEMLPSMTDILPDCVGWQSKTYPEHFFQIGLDYGPLSAEAYPTFPRRSKCRLN